MTLTFKGMLNHYCSANKLKQQFSKCSLEVKNYLFKHFCMPFYGSYLSCNYSKYNISRLRTGSNDSYRILHHIPRYVSARNHQVQSNIDTLDQWFSTFLVERNPNKTFQRLEEPLCGNLIVLCQGGPTSAPLWATFQNYSSLRAVTG